MENYKISKIKMLITSMIWILLILSNHFFYKHIPYQHYLYPFNISLFEEKLFLLRLINFLLIYVIVSIIEKFWKKRKSLTNKEKLFLEALILMPMVLSVGFIKLYPGIWENDAMHILEYASTLTTVSWHNIYTSLFYIICLSFIAHPVGIVIGQMILITIIIAYIYANLFDKYKCKIRYLIFIFFLTNVNQFYTNWVFRTTISSYLELFIIFYTLFNLKRNCIKNPHYILYLITVSFVVSYRSENIVYLLLPIVLNIHSWKQIRKTMLTVLFATIIITIPQKFVSQKYYQSDYLIISTFEPLQYVLNSLPEDEQLLKEKDDIEKIIPLNYIQNYGQHSYFEYNFENNNFGTVANKEGQKEYLKSVFTIFLKNYKLFFKSKINGFTYVLVNKAYFPTYPNYSLRTEYYFKDEYSKLQDYTVEKYNTRPGFVSLTTTYKLIIPLICILILCIYTLFKRKKEFLVLLTLLIKIPIIILFAPGCSFMYFYYIYLTSFFLTIFFLIKGLNKKM